MILASGHARVRTHQVREAAPRQDMMCLGLLSGLGFRSLGVGGEGFGFGFQGLGLEGFQTHTHTHTLSEDD